MNLKDRLSHLNYQEARKLLGPEGDRLIRQGGRYEIDIAAQVELDANRFLVRLNGSEVTIRMDPSRNRKLHYSCSSCEAACEHAGAAFSLILEEKLALGLAIPPPDKAPLETLSDEELLQRALEERAERMRKDRMSLESADPARRSPPCPKREQSARPPPPPAAHKGAAPSALPLGRSEAPR